MSHNIYPFTHLHVHSFYSTLDGLSSIPQLVEAAREDGQRGLALTDHGNMFGIKEFYNHVQKINSPINKNIKNLKEQLNDAISNGGDVANIESQIAEEKKKLFVPIFGCECYCARRGRLSKQNNEFDRSGYHLIVLAKNKVGYNNLIKMVSISYSEGKYHRPRIDKELLEKYHEGLIISSACLGGEIPRLIAQDKLQEAEESIRWFKNIFGDDYYLELQRHKTDDPTADRTTFLRQESVNKHILDLARKVGVKVIATNDVHFAREENAEAHDRLICVSMGKLLDDPNRLRYTKQEWLKTQAQMSEIFQDIPFVLTNTQEILDKVEIYSIDNPPLMPHFPIPENFTDADDYLRHLTYVGAQKRYGENLSEELKERLEFELNTIKNMGYPGYFLIVQDFIAAGRAMGVAVGPGRGSAAGSAVAYCLGITNIDPIKYDLLFERFLNPDRISLPDIDIDFDDDGRFEVIKWVTEKYGVENVAHIITFQTMASKSAIKDVARVTNVSIAESNHLAKLIPARLPDVKKIDITSSLQHVPELAEIYGKGDKKIRETLDYAIQLEGTVRSTGIHACGIIIGQSPISDVVPIATSYDKEIDEEILVTQYEGNIIEETGLIKMDFLGLKTLSIIKEGLKNIKSRHGIEIDIDAIPLDDAKTFELFCKGNTSAVFQFESAGMQKYMKELRPSRFEDLIAMNALYRPGPMDYIPSFIKRKHGEEEISYDLPCMERYLANTYGITVYQEQVMLLSREIADFTRGQSDELRKAMGKKIIEKMMTLKDKFMAGGSAKGYPNQTLEKIWADWEKFASYAFNKSHSTCYAYLAYQTAYLKAHYPPEFMAGVLSRNVNNATEVTKYIDECQKLGIQVLCPDVNESDHKFTVNKDGNIRYGLEAIKGMPKSAVHAIVSEREANGPFTDIYNFFERVNLSACTRKALESIVYSGGFDSFSNYSREDFVVPEVPGDEDTFLLKLFRYGQKVQQDKHSMQLSLFGDSDFQEMAKPCLNSHPPKWSDIERLKKERELLGISISASPLDKYAITIKHFCNSSILDLNHVDEFVGKEMTMAGVVTGFRQAYTKKGQLCGFIKVQDFEGEGEIALFGDSFPKFSSYGVEGMYIYAQIRVDVPHYRSENKKPFVNIVNITSLDNIHDNLKYDLEIEIPITNLTEEIVAEIGDLLAVCEEGDTNIYFHFVDSIAEVRLKMQVERPLNISVDLLDYLTEAELKFTLAQK